MLLQHRMWLVSIYLYETFIISTVCYLNKEIRRQQMLEAAEKRRLENESRGIKDLDKVKRQQQRDAERDRIESEMAKHGSGNPNLKVCIFY